MGKEWSNFLERWELDELATIKRELKALKEVKIKVVKDVEHVVGVTYVGDELMNYLENPVGWNETDLESFLTASELPEGCPKYDQKYVEKAMHFLRAYDPKITRSAKRRGQVKVLYIPKYPILFWPEGSEFLILLAPLVEVS